MNNQNHAVARKRVTVLIVALLVCACSVLSVYFVSQVIKRQALAEERLQQPTATQPAVGDTVARQQKNDAAKEQAAEQQAAQKAQEIWQEADILRRGYFYDEAQALLQKNNAAESDKLTALQKQIEQDKAALTPTTQAPRHIFFHSLIVDTKLAFDNVGYSAEGYNTWMTTAYELKKMLPLLQEAGYVLYDIEDLVTFGENGEAKAKEVLLPPGKKPLVLSIDDVDYYEYMKGDGFASRLTVNADGQVATVMTASDGTESVTMDGDVVPIVDAYVQEHPEFSWRGAKGIVATTGYEGAFGYRISGDFLQGQALEDARAQVKKVAQALLDSGWKIACHSYTHNQYFAEKTITQAQMQYDLDKWKREIEPYVLGSNIYISPFGVDFDRDDPRYRYIIDNGFSIYCPVYKEMDTEYEDDHMVQYRLNLDGYTLLCHPDRVKKYFFDPALVVDPSRPPLDPSAIS